MDFLWDFGDSTSTRTTTGSVTKTYKNPGRLGQKHSISIYTGDDDACVTQVPRRSARVRRREPERHRRVPAGHPETGETHPAAAPGVRPAEPHGDRDLSGQRGNRRQLPVEFWRRVFTARTQYRAARLPNVSLTVDNGGNCCWAPCQSPCCLANLFVAV